MVEEVVALGMAKGVIGLGSALRSAIETVDMLRVKKKLRGDQLNAVKKNLEDVRKKIDRVKNTGGLLGDYMKYSQKAHDIRTMSDKIGELIGNFEKPTNTEWVSIKKMFENVKVAHVEFTTLKTGGGIWLDDRDRGSILTRLGDVTKKYDAAKGDLDNSRLEELKGDKGSIAGLKDKALELESLFNGSIDGMLKGLTSI